jgi:hypothetical protein
VVLQVVRALEVDRFGLVVGAAVDENPLHVRAEGLLGLVLVAGQLHLNCLEVDGILDDRLIVGHIVLGNWLTERP